MSNSRLVSHRPRGLLTSPSAVAVVAFTSLAWIVVIGPAWLRAVPEALTLPIAQVVGDALNWFAREATIGGVAITDLTRILAAFFDYVTDGTVVVVAKGIFNGSGLNVTTAVPPLSWSPTGGPAGDR